MYDYKLENGVIINSDRIIEAVLQEAPFPQLYLDTETGALVEIPSKESLGMWVREIGKTKRYLSIEPFTKEERIQYAHEFINLILKAELKEKKLKEANKAADTGDWLEFEGFLMFETDGWFEGWRQFIQDTAWEYVNDWLTQNPNVKIKAEFSGFCDCAICKVMKDGKGGDPKALQAAFSTESLMQQVTEQIAKNKELTDEKKGDVDSLEKKSGNNKKTTKEAFVFKVSLNNSTPKVWRRIVVPSNYSFFELHSAIVDAMGWKDYHLHSFLIDISSKSDGSKKRSAKDRVIIELSDPEFSDGDDKLNTKDERYEHIADWFGKVCEQCGYTYDFGDNWDHTVLLEKVIPLEPKTKYPQCTAGKNACPPEDCGGVWGYMNIQEVLKNPNHEEHADMLEWLNLEKASDFDPSYFDPKEVVFSNSAKKLK